MPLAKRAVRHPAPRAAAEPLKKVAGARRPAPSGGSEPLKEVADARRRAPSPRSKGRAQTSKQDDPPSRAQSPPLPPRPPHYSASAPVHSQPPRRVSHEREFPLSWRASTELRTRRASPPPSTALAPKAAVSAPTHGSRKLDAPSKNASTSRTALAMENATKRRKMSLVALSLSPARSQLKMADNSDDSSSDRNTHAELRSRRISRKRSGQAHRSLQASSDGAELTNKEEREANSLTVMNAKSPNNRQSSRSRSLLAPRQSQTRDAGTEESVQGVDNKRIKTPANARFARETNVRILPSRRKDVSAPTPATPDAAAANDRDDRSASRTSQRRSQSKDSSKLGERRPRKENPGESLQPSHTSMKERDVRLALRRETRFSTTRMKFRRGPWRLRIGGKDGQKGAERNSPLNETSPTESVSPPQKRPKLIARATAKSRAAAAVGRRNCDTATLTVTTVAQRTGARKKTDAEMAGAANSGDSPNASDDTVHESKQRGRKKSGFKNDLDTSSIISSYKRGSAANTGTNTTASVAPASLRRLTDGAKSTSHQRESSHRTSVPAPVSAEANVSRTRCPSGPLRRHGRDSKASVKSTSPPPRKDLRSASHPSTPRVKIRPAGLSTFSMPNKTDIRSDDITSSRLSTTSEERRTFVLKTILKRSSADPDRLSNHLSKKSLPLKSKGRNT